MSYEENGHGAGMPLEAVGAELAGVEEEYQTVGRWSKLVAAAGRIVGPVVEFLTADRFATGSAAYNDNPQPRRGPADWV